MFQIVENTNQDAKIKVIGVGGGGGNALEHMIDKGIEGVEFIAANTDSQALKRSNAAVSLRLGENVTHGLGAGADPIIGREAAIEARENIRAALEDADMVFIAAGMGGGTGTGATPVIAEIANEIGSLTVAVVTKPFLFEREKRMNTAVAGIEALNSYVDSLITIPNEKLITVLGKERPLVEAFKEADDVLFSAVQGIAELITREGLINLDFADVKTVMMKKGMAMMGVGCMSGENRAYEAAQAAINNPLLEDVDFANASGILVNVMAGPSLTMGEHDEIGSCMAELAADDATVVIGAVIDEAMGDEIRVTLIATGLGASADAASEAEPLAVLPQPRAVSSESSPAAAEYQNYETPAVNRHNHNAATGGQRSGSTPAVAPEADYDRYIDIPSFLRHQLD